MHIGNKIKELADNKKLSAQKLGKAIGISKQSVYALYKKEHISTSMLHKVADALGERISVFIDENIDDKPNFQLQLDSYGSQQGNESTQQMNPHDFSQKEHDELVRLRAEIKIAKKEISDKDEFYKAILNSKDREIEILNARIEELKERIEELKAQKK